MSSRPITSVQLPSVWISLLHTTFGLLFVLVGGQQQNGRPHDRV